MSDLPVLQLALSSWILGVLVGAIGATRHALRWRPPPTRPPPLPPMPPWDHTDTRPTLPDVLPGPWPPPRPPSPPPGPVQARGICFLCGLRWGTCDHTRNG